MNVIIFYDLAVGFLSSVIFDKYGEIKKEVYSKIYNKSIDQLCQKYPDLEPMHIDYFLTQDKVKKSIQDYLKCLNRDENIRILHDEFYKSFEFKSLNDNGFTENYSNLILDDLFKILNEIIQQDHDLLTYLNRYYLEKIYEMVSSRTKIHYDPEEPPKVSDFFDRTEYLMKFSKNIDGKVIVLQGLPAIGKTSLAIKIKEILDNENEYVTSWKEIYSFNNFEDISHYFAGLMRYNGNYKLAEYIERGEKDVNEIIRLICEGLINKKYVIFFDNCHKNTDEKVNILFNRISKEPGISTILFVTRYNPSFIDDTDIIMNKIIHEEVKDFEYNTNKKFQESINLSLNESQRVLLYQKIGGNPFFNLLIKNLVIKDEFDKILYNIPKSGIGRYLYNNIYTILNEDEKNLFKIMSIFRRPFISDACFYVSKKENVIETLESLKDKNLVKMNESYDYSLHDTVRDYGYSLISKPTKQSYHQLAAEYYSKLDKTYENIEETIYHCTNSNMLLSEDFIKYLLKVLEEKPSDVSINLLIVSAFQNNSTESPLFFDLSTKSPLFFDLIRKVSSDQSLEIKRLAVNALVKNKDLDGKKALNILKEFISDEDVQLRSTSINLLGQFFERYFDDCIYIIDGIILNGNSKDILSLCYAIKDSKCKNEKIKNVLKNISVSTKGKGNVDINCKLLARDILEELYPEDPDIISKKLLRLELLGQLKLTDRQQCIEYLDNLVFRSDEFNKLNLNYFLIIKLLEISYEFDKEYITTLMKKMIEISTKNQKKDLIIPTSIALLSSEGFYYDSVKSFVRDENLYVRISGFLTVVQAYTCAFFLKNKYSIKDEDFICFIRSLEKRSISIMDLLIDESLKIPNDESLRQMATIFREEIRNPSKKKNQKSSKKLITTVANTIIDVTPKNLIKAVLDITPENFIEYVRVTNTEEHSVHMMIFVAFMAFTNIEPEKLYPIWENKQNSTIVRPMLSYYFSTMRTSPISILNLIKKSGLYSDSFLDKSYSIYRVSFLSLAIPDEVIVLYEKLLSDPLYQDKNLEIMIMFSFSLLQKRTNFFEELSVEMRNSESNRIRKDVQRLTQNLLSDGDEQVRKFAEIVVNEKYN